MFKLSRSLATARPKLSLDAAAVKNKGKDVSTVTFSPHEFQVHRCEPPEYQSSLQKEDGLAYLRQMLMIRRMEMAADALYKERAIRGFCHLAIGQVSIHA